MDFPLASEAASNLETQGGSPVAEQSDVFALDSHTLRDLEVFESQTGATSLFEFCNLTRCNGGADALRRRMAHPWCDAARIRATQESLSFILGQREAFNELASIAYTTRRVERYLHDALAVVPHENALEFSFGALALWYDSDRAYTKIVFGAQITCELIRRLRRFVGKSALASPVGELDHLLQEARALLGRSKMARVPDREIGGRSIWRLLRIDQAFRVHEKGAISRLLELVYDMDALVALADVTDKHGFVLPRIETGPLCVHAEGLTHPSVQDAVANPVDLDQGRRVLFLTGPNMAGKTTYLRAFATALYFAHLGIGVPADSFRFVPAQRLFTSISLNDDLHRGLSYFRAEALRMKAIAEAVADGDRVIALMDEPFKGTNLKDALEASLAILSRFSIKNDCLFVFSSHLIELKDELAAMPEIDYRCFEAGEEGISLRFEYVLRPGVSSQRLGMRVLREEGVFALLDGPSQGNNAARLERHS